MRRTIKLFVISLITGLCCFFLFSSASSAATFTVTSTGNDPDSVIDGVCDDGVGECTLRAAIEEVNSSADPANTIQFNIAPLDQSVKTINIGSELPSILRPLEIDGITQDDSQCGELVPSLPATDNEPHTLRIQISGDSNSTAFIKNAPTDLTVRGLVINNMSQAFYGEATNTIIECNYFGTNPAGTSSTNDLGYVIDSYVVTDPNDLEITNNLIAATEAGVDVEGAAYVHHNLFGTAADGKTSIMIPDLDNENGAVRVGDEGIVSNNVIGRYTYGAYVGGNNLQVTDNHIGTGITGTEQLGNGQAGVFIDENSQDVLVENNLVANSGDMDFSSLPSEYNDYIDVLTSGIVDFSDASVPNESSTISNNVIHSNRGSGVSVVNGGTLTSTISENSIYGNGLIGIDLVTFDPNEFIFNDLGPNGNDIGDSDSGSNGYLNFSVLNSVKQSSDGSEAVINYNLDAADSPTDEYRLEFFANETADESGYGEGQVFLGAITTSNGSNQQANITLPDDIDLSSMFITTTTTTINEGIDSGFGSTSEFSLALDYSAQTDAAQDGQLAESGVGILGVVLIAIAMFTVGLRVASQKIKYVG